MPPACNLIFFCPAPRGIFPLPRQRRAPQPFLSPGPAPRLPRAALPAPRSPRPPPPPAPQPLRAACAAALCANVTFPQAPPPPGSSARRCQERGAARSELEGGPLISGG